MDCCKNCVEKRQRICATGVNCHSVCEDYLKEREKLDDFNKLKRTQTETQIIGYRREREKRFDKS